LLWEKNTANLLKQVDGADLVWEKSTAGE
jgi:hypothetical protein